MDEMLKLEDQLSKINVDHWLQHDLFSWRWWLLLLDKTRKAEIILYGFIISTIVIFLDVLGWNLNLWTYNFRLLPMCTPLFPVDIITIPVVYMVIYQYCHSWRSFFSAMTVVAAIFAFILEPIAMWIGYYIPLAWEHIYSFPIYVSNALLGRLALLKLTSSEY